MNNKEKIVKLLKNKSSTKQEVFRKTMSVFNEIQQHLKTKADIINNELGATAFGDVQVTYSSDGSFESKLNFSGDTLLFHMHSNVFDFQKSNSIHKTKYVKEDKLRSFCGVINIYNFLSDSFKYNRMNDAGYLIARIFINKDKHFFVEGDKQLGLLFNDFINQQINTDQIDKIIDETMVYALNFDLQAPNFTDVKVVSIHHILDMNNNQKLKTAKRMGYKFSFETNND